MKPKGRYTSREQIVEQIDKWSAKADKYRARAGRLFQSAIEMRKEALTKNTAGAIQRLFTSALNTDEEGDKNIDKCARIRGGKLKTLSAKLAEFDTETLPGITEDKSVEAI